MEIGGTSAPPISRIAHEAVCQSIRVKTYTPLLVVIGSAATKQNRHVPAVTYCVQPMEHYALSPEPVIQTMARIISSDQQPTRQ